MDDATLRGQQREVRSYSVTRSYHEVDLAGSTVQIIRNLRTAFDRAKAGIAFQRDWAVGGMDIVDSIPAAVRLRHESAESSPGETSPGETRAGETRAGHCRSIKRSFAGYCQRTARDREKVSAADGNIRAGR